MVVVIKINRESINFSTRTRAKIDCKIVNKGGAKIVFRDDFSSFDRRPVIMPNALRLYEVAASNTLLLGIFEFIEKLKLNM